jgi:polyisoprenoid-binding protein YceI
MGTTKNLKLNVQFGGLNTDPWKNEKAGFTVTGTIKRSDWGLVWNTALETGGFMVSDEVNISCEIELINTNPTDLKMELETSAKEKTSI